MNATDPNRQPGWLAGWRRHKVLGTSFFVVAMAIVVVATWLAPKQYRSEGALYFRLGRENTTLDPTATVGQGPVMISPSSREREVNSILEILQSRGMAEALVDAVGGDAILRDGESVSESADESAGLMARLGIRPELDRREQAVLRVGGRLQVTAADEANIIWVAYESHTPAFARRVVDELIACYQQKHLEVHRSAGSRNFLTEQTESAKQRLADAESSLATVKQRTRLIAPDEQRQALVSQAARLEMSLLENEVAEKSMALRVQTLQAMLSEVPKTQVTSHTSGIANAAADRMRDRLYALQLIEQDLLGKNTAEHPSVVAIRKQIGEAKAILEGEDDLRTEVTEGISKAHESGQISLLELSPMLAALREKSDSLRGQLDDTKLQLQQLNKKELEVARLTREVDLADQEYRRFVAGRNQARLDEALELERISNVSVVQQATASPLPVRPNWLLNLAVGFVLALAGSWGFTGLVDSWKPATKSQPVPRREPRSVSSSGHRFAHSSAAGVAPPGRAGSRRPGHRQRHHLYQFRADWPRCGRGRTRRLRDGDVAPLFRHERPGRRHFYLVHHPLAALRPG